MKKILVHGSGHRAASWGRTISYMRDREEILCPDLGELIKGREAGYNELYASFVEYCGGFGEQVHLCGLSLGGVLALEYTLEHPEKVGSLALIGTPYKVPKGAFALQNIVFRLMPRSAFDGMPFDKRGSLALFGSMKELDFGGRLQGIKCPTLIICGEKDGVNMKPARYLAENIGGAQLVIVEKAGHVVNEEAPEALAKVLDGFYSGIK